MLIQRNFLYGTLHLLASNNDLESFLLDGSLAKARALP